MALCVSVAAAVAEAIAQEDTRTIILVDQFSAKRTVMGRFLHRYDASSSADISNFFDDTHSVLMRSLDDIIFTAQALPILRYIGMHKVTILKRVSPYDIIVSDAENCSVDSQIGLGTF